MSVTCNLQKNLSIIPKGQLNIIDRKTCQLYIIDRKKYQLGITVAVNDRKL